MHAKNNIPFSKRFQYGLYHTLDQFIGKDRGHSLTKNSRKNYYKNLLSYLKERGVGQIIPIERRTDLSLKEFKEKYLKLGIPVVMEGAASDWPCVKKWGFDYFKELHGNDEILMADQMHIENPYERITLAEIIDGINQGTGKYYRFYPLLVRHPEHLLDFDYDWLRKRRNQLSYVEAFQVFLGGDKSITPLHNANLCNLFTQVVGEKKWVLYHQSNTAVIDPQPVEAQYRGAPFKRESGPFDPFHPDYNQPYELFKYISGLSVHLKPGDVLWNPPYYWHAVENIGKSIGVGYRWFAPLYCYKIEPFYSLLDSLAINPPIWKFLKLIKKDGNLVHLMKAGMLENYLKEEKNQS